MRNNYSLKRSFSLLVVKVVISTVLSIAMVLIGWFLWLSIFPRNYYDKIYAPNFLNNVKKEIPNLLSTRTSMLQEKDSKFQYLILIDGRKVVKSSDFPKSKIRLTKISSETNSFVENHKVYVFEKLDQNPSVKVMMIYPAFSTGNPFVDYLNILFQYFIVASPFIFFIVFLSFFTSKLYKNIRWKFRIIESHLANIEAGDLSQPLPTFLDNEFGELSRQVNQMRIELKNLLDDSQQKAVVQKHLFSSIAHDVRTPLTVINAETEMLELLSENTEIKRTCAVITSEVSKVDQLLTELLKMARLNMDSYTLNCKKVDINDFLHEVFAEFSGLFESKK
ncbi:histidine kinase dimerization/phospho-acceptor domain-containing protein [Agrilactobacillus fermenti]|uniref:sensor histidine kinase n=1 Tax=Agrilactobacillus fermenti TaxID=2586909 RepID=UPI001E53E53B|nr:HAMP domain-containing sensor histidine kinase [Agrilactobacillus fermenti]